jgi:uncharacterized protein (TIGR01777 family)
VKNERIILAGGSGFIGTMLARDLVARGYDVIVLSRGEMGSQTPDQKHLVTRHPSLVTCPWDGRTLGPWSEHLNGARAVVNLAGRSVNCRHTEANRREINESRVNSVKVLAAAIHLCRQPPRVWVQAGGQGIYGDAGPGDCDENTPPGDGFLLETCRLWEGAFNESSTPDTRHVLLRIGFVLGADGGALKTLATLTRFGLGGTVGNGRQPINWIHSADLDRIFISAIERPDWEGVFNASGPNPATNAEFMHELRRTLRRPWSPPAPAWAVRIGAWLMGSDGRLALTGRRCVPKRLQDRGFTFNFPNLSAALNDILGRARP